MDILREWRKPRNNSKDRMTSHLMQKTRWSRVSLPQPALVRRAPPSLTRALRSPVVAKKRCVCKVGGRQRGSAKNNTVHEAILEELKKIREERQPLSMTNQILVAGAGVLFSTGLTAASNSVVVFFMTDRCM